MSFLTDLKQWEAMEEEVAKQLTTYFWKTVNKNEDDRKWVDLVICDWKLLIEVKYDRMVQDTWNYVFEFECNGKESGLERKYQTEEWWLVHPHFLVQSHNEWFELYHTYQLLQYVKENNDRTVKGGDGWRSHMYLIERAKIEHLIIKKFVWN